MTFAASVMMFLFSYDGNPRKVYEDWKGRIKNLGVYQIDNSIQI